MDFVAEAQQVIGEVAAVLARNAGTERFFCHDGDLPQIFPLAQQLARFGIFGKGA
jgi:hypothetical protein